MKKKEDNLFKKKQIYKKLAEKGNFKREIEREDQEQIFNSIRLIRLRTMLLRIFNKMVLFEYRPCWQKVVLCLRV